MFWLFSFSFGSSSFGYTSYLGFTRTILRLVHDWGNKSESGRVRSTHEALSVEPFFFFSSSLSLAVAIRVIFSSFVPAKQEAHICGLEIYGRYYAHT